MDLGWDRSKWGLRRVWYSDGPYIKKKREYHRENDTGQITVAGWRTFISLGQLEQKHGQYVLLLITHHSPRSVLL